MTKAMNRSVRYSTYKPGQQRVQKNGDILQWTRGSGQGSANGYWKYVGNQAAASQAPVPAPAAAPPPPPPVYTPTPLTISNSAPTTSTPTVTPTAALPAPAPTPPPPPPEYAPGGIGAALNNNSTGFRRKKSSSRESGSTTKGTSVFKISKNQTPSSGLNIGV